MADEIRPALTPEQWADGGFDNGCGSMVFWNEANNYFEIEQKHRLVRDGWFAHGIAAVMLHGQRFGFTHEDVAILTECATGCEGTENADDEDRVFPDGIRMRMKDVRRLASLAARISALLPPKESTAFGDLRAPDEGSR